MFRALVIGLGSLSLIALLVVGLRQIDPGAASERIARFFTGGEPASPILRQAEADAQYVRQEDLTAMLSELRDAIAREEDQREELAAQLRSLQAQQARIADALADLDAGEASVPTQAELTAPAPASPARSDARAASLAEQETRLDALQDEVEDKLAAFAATQEQLDRTVRSLQRDIEDAAPDLEPLETRLRRIELEMQELANTVSNQSGRIDRLVLGTGAAPAAASGVAVQSELTCAPERVDDVFRRVSEQRLREMYDACQGGGSRPPRLSSLRNSTNCYELQQWEACLGVERVYLRQQ
jgi:ABC-type transporter Mla subunit MlaD